MRIEGPHLEGVPEAVMAEVEQELWLIGKEIEALAVKYLDDNNINYNADLRNSITSEVEKTLGKMELRVGPNVDYAIFVHEGTRPHWPPKNVIRKWVVRKLGLKGADADRATFFIRRKIARVGTPPRPFMLEALNAHKKLIARRIAQAVARGIRNKN